MSEKQMGERAYNQSRAKAKEGLRVIVAGINTQLNHPEMSRLTRAEILGKQATAVAEIQEAWEEVDEIAKETDTIIKRLERKLARFAERLTGKNEAAPPRD